VLGEPLLPWGSVHRDALQYLRPPWGTSMQHNTGYWRVVYLYGMRCLCTVRAPCVKRVVARTRSIEQSSLPRCVSLAMHIGHGNLVVLVHFPNNDTLRLAGCSPGLVLLSPEFVRKEYCMAEVNILLRRRRAGGVLLLPVLYKGLEVADLSNMRRLYKTQKWCVKEKKPDGRTLDAWAADLAALTSICMIRCDQVAPCSLALVQVFASVVIRLQVGCCACGHGVHAVRRRTACLRALAQTC
jgi:hypothetical protein